MLCRDPPVECETVNEPKGVQPEMISYARSIEVIARPDVLVCGAGSAGVAAAIAAARAGASTMVVEQWGFSGGNITAALVPGCCGLADMTTGELAVGGIPLELMGRTGAIELPLKSSTKLFDPVTRPEDQARNKQPFWWDVERFKIEADRLLVGLKVDVMYHTRVIDTLGTESRIDRVVIGSKDGVAAVRPKVVIDCTGDADVAFWAGVKCEVADTIQPMSLVFRVGGAEIAARTDIRELQDRCGLALEKAWDKERGVYAGPWIRYLWPGVLSFSATRLPFNSSSARDLTRAEIKGREDAWQIFEILKQEVPELRDAFFLTSGPTVGSRESRRICGVYRLTVEDILATRRFPDAVVKGSWYVDQHPPGEPGYHRHLAVPAYDIPYRSLIPEVIENLLVAGRCHSVTSEALASTRVAVTGMGMGQAAGVAAAMAVEGGLSFHEVDVRRLQQRLLSQGAVLDPG